MTDRETLFTYRLGEAKRTLSDAEEMLKNSYSYRSVVNRAYYSMFYALLALFLKSDMNIQTSKHKGVIAVFDKEFVHGGKIDKKYSVMLHSVYELRQEGDYKELVEISEEDAREAVQEAKEFLAIVEP